jgi:hypothetical protein
MPLSNIQLSLNITTLLYIWYVFWHDHTIAGASEKICGQFAALMLFIRTLMFVCTWQLLTLKSFPTSVDLEHVRNYSIIKLKIKFKDSPGIHV